MTTNWRELRDSIASEGAFNTFNPFSLRGNTEESNEKESSTERDSLVNSVKSQFEPTPPFRNPKAKSAESAESLEVRLEHHRIAIAIDKATGSACLVFHQDVDRLREANVATFVEAVRLTPSQRRETEDSLEYYERLIEERNER